MRRLTFPLGGIHPPDGKRHTRHLPSRNAVIPQTSVVPLLQHVGQPATACVVPGDRVREGMLIGRASGENSAHIHAPIPGVVREIREIALAGAVRCEAIVIDMGGEFDRLGKRLPAHEWRSLEPESILRLIRDHGIVGMGGHAVGSHLKYGAAAGRAVETLILNGAESEPYLSADHRVMVERSAAVLTGLQIVARLLAAERVVVAIEANKPDAIAAMSATIRELGLAYDVVKLAVKYPQGDERQLIRAVRGREIPSGGVPLDVACMTIDVATGLAIHDAIVYRHPLIERVVTVGGDAVASPANIKVRIGTAIGDLIDECGGFSTTPAKIVVGGPMMGQTVTDLRTPITKDSRGILALTRNEVRQAPRTPCIQCGRCVESCPMGLDPSLLFRLIDHHNVAGALGEGLLDCTECGSCGYICPSRIPLVQGLRIGKARARDLR
ncbi:MAG: electron transport complex subunit RsxC [Spirochaetota bacterium]